MQSRMGRNKSGAAQYILDLTSRVFRAKLYDLKDQLYKKEIFGKVAMRVHVIEFQKKGLPHAHMLVILEPYYKLKNPYDFDEYVSAEIPNENIYLKLYKMISKQMMQRLYGDQNPNSPSMIGKKCRFLYPILYSLKTTQGKYGYLIYRRLNNG